MSCSKVNLLLLYLTRYSIHSLGEDKRVAAYLTRQCSRRSSYEQSYGVHRR